MADIGWKSSWIDGTPPNKANIRNYLRDQVTGYSTIAEVKANTNYATRAFVTPIGVFIYDPADTTTANDDINTLVDATGARYKRSDMFRDRLLAGRAYYVRADGSNSNNGLANTAAGAFATLQKAIDTVSLLDLRGQTATINVGDGTWAPVSLKKLNGGVCNVIGNTATPTNCVINSTGASNIYGDDVSGWFFDGFYFTGNSYHVQLTNGASLDLGRVNFGPTTTPTPRAHKLLQNNSRLRHLNIYTISGGAGAHEQIDTGARLQNFGFVHILTGTPDFSTAFLLADTAASANYGGASWSGSATGKRFDIQGNAVAKSFGVTLPGSIAGTTATGGQFI